MNSAHGAGTILAAVFMWQAMMSAMMLPVALPWFRVLTRLQAAGTERSGRGAKVVGPRAPVARSAAPALALFALGYFGVWTCFSVAAAAAQVGLQGAGLVGPAASLPARAGGLLFACAGLYQLTPAKKACLKHCRNPLTYLLTRWHNGPRGFLVLGASHGVFCLGCCWLIMSLGFVAGVMNLAWMAVLTALICLETLAPAKTDWRQLIAAVLIAVGAVGLIAG